MTDPAANLMTPREFAVSRGYKPNYGHQLRKDGRLVMAPDGKNVLVAESIVKLAATRDPSMQGVADRHARSRATSVTATETTTDAADAGEAPSAEDDQTDPVAMGGYDFQVARSKREHFAAEREHLNLRKESGDLMERTAVVAMMADAGSAVRSALEAWVHDLPPQLVQRDESAIGALLADRIERILSDLSDRFARLATQESR